MEEKLISIITITYNAASEIGVTANSVKLQNLSNEEQLSVEHLVIDGASNDDTVAIARQEGRCDIRIVSERDSGLYDAMNKGLHLARGRYVLFLNAGDTLHDNETLSAYIKAAKSGADIIYGDTNIVDSKREYISARHLRVPKRLTRGSLKKGMLVCHQALMVRKELAPDYNLAYRFSADYDWEIKCVAATVADRCVNLQRVTIDYLSDGLTDKNKKASLKERFEVMRHHYGITTAVLMHLWFVPRLGVRKLKRFINKKK